MSKPKKSREIKAWVCVEDDLLRGDRALIACVRLYPTRHLARRLRYEHERVVRVTIRIEEGR